MLRASRLSTATEFTVEHRREDIRDRRSERFCERVDALARAFAKSAGSLASAAVLAHLLGWL